MRVVQESDRTPHTPTTYELDRQQRWGTRPPKYDHSPSDRPRIEIASRWGGQRSTRRDGVRGPLEGKLGGLLHEIELRHAEAVERRIREERELAERKRQWEIAVEQAKVELRESHRPDVIHEEAAAWRQARELREYLVEMEAVLAAESDSDKRAAGREWLEWASRYIESLDPLCKWISLPEDLEPTAQALAPFLPSRRLYGVRGW